MSGLTGLPLAAVRLILLGVSAALLWELVSRIGAGVLGGRRTPGGPAAAVRFGAGILVGWGILGPAFLGLALTGILYPGTVAGLALGLLAASPAGLVRRSPLLAAARGVAGIPLAGWASSVFPALLLAPWMLVPESQQDVFTYHLGAPWQFLQVHRAVLDRVFMDFHLPLPVEMSFVIPLSLGIERLGRFIVLSHFAAVSAIWAGVCLAQGRRTAAWLGSVLALGTAHLPWLMTMSTNDSAAAAFIAAGWLFQRRRDWSMAAVLYGFGIAAKPVFGPLAVVLLIFDPPQIRIAAGLIAPLALPAVLWWAKTWLATGNPFFPLATGLFPSLRWGPLNYSVFESYMRTLQPADTFRWLDIPGAMLRHLDDGGVLVALCLPGLMLLGRNRRAAWACAVGGAIVLRYGHFPRFLLPAEWLVCLLAAGEACRMPRAVRSTAALGLAAYVAVRLASHPLIQPAPWREAGRPLNEVRSGYLETFADVNGDIEDLGARRVMTVGELATYRIPARVVFTGMLGQTPVVWSMVTASRTEHDLARKYRQLGRPLIAHNVVGALRRSTRYAAFEWDARMLKLYRGFCLRHLELARAPSRSDTRVGCYYLWRFLDRPRRGAPRPEEAYFMPGTSSMKARAITLRNQGRHLEAIAECRRILRTVPGLGCVRSELGTIMAMAGMWCESYAVLKPSIDADILDSKNFGMFALAAGMCGHFEDADRVYPLCLDRYRMAQPGLLADWGEMLRMWAQSELRAGRIGSARRLLFRATRTLNAVPRGAVPGADQSRDANLALVEQLMGELAGDGLEM